jgi:hypothetical protein
MRIRLLAASVFSCGQTERSVFSTSHLAIVGYVP